MRGWYVYISVCAGVLVCLSMCACLLVYLYGCVGEGGSPLGRTFQTCPLALEILSWSAVDQTKSGTKNNQQKPSFCSFCKSAGWIWAAVKAAHVNIIRNSQLPRGDKCFLYETMHLLLPRLCSAFCTGLVWCTVQMCSMCSYNTPCWAWPVFTTVPETPECVSTHSGPVFTTSSKLVKTRYDWAKSSTSRNECLEYRWDTC